MSLYLMTDHVRIVYEVLCASGHGNIVEAQTAEEAKSLSKTESCDHNRSADASQPDSCS